MVSVEVRGAYALADGSPATGRVTFTPRRAVNEGSGGTGHIIPASKVTGTLVAGAFTVTLQATDDPLLDAPNFTYEVREQIAGASSQRSYDIDVPTSAAGTGIDLVDVAPVSASDGDPTAFVTLTAFTALAADVAVLEAGSALALLKASNLADLGSASVARTNLGLGLSLGPSNGVDDTTAINAALASAVGQTLRGLSGQAYKISAPLLVPSGTILDMTGASVTLVAGSNCNMVNNPAITPAASGTDASISNGSAVVTTTVTAAVGQTVMIQGAGGGTGFLVGIVSAVGSGSLTLAKLDGTPALAKATVSAATITVHTRDAGIQIVGGTWDRGANGGSFAQQHSIRLRHVDGLKLQDMTCTETNGKFFINPADCYDVLIENIQGDTTSNLIQPNGPLTRFLIRNIHGRSNDDTVALVPHEWAGYNDCNGDITDGVVENVYATSTGASLVKILSGPGGDAKRIVVRGVFGSVLAQAAVFLGNDYAQANTTGGLVDMVEVEHLYALTANNVPAVFINGATMGRIRVAGINSDNASATQPLINVAPGVPGATLASLRVERAEIKATGAFPLVNISANANLTRLTIDGVNVTAAATTATSSIIASINGPITDCRIRNVEMAGITGGYAVRVTSAVIARMTVDRVHVSNSTNGASVVRVDTSGVVTDLAISNAGFTVASGNCYALSMGATTSSCSRAALFNVRIAGPGGLVSSTSAATLPRVSAVDCDLAGASWVADLATTTTFVLLNLAHTSPVNGSFNVRATGAVTIRGAVIAMGGNPSIAAGGKLTVLTPDMAPSAVVGGVPTIAVGAGLGTGAPAAAIVGTDKTGTVTLTTGTTPTAAAVCVVTYTQSLGGSPRTMAITPSNPAAIAAGLYVSGKTSTTWTVSASNAPTGNMTFDYMIGSSN